MQKGIPADLGAGERAPAAWVTADEEGAGPHWLLIRRGISDGEYAFYRAHAPGPVPLAQLMKVAVIGGDAGRHGRRWGS